MSKKIKFKITGNTYRSKEWIKDEGGTWDGDCWTIECDLDDTGKLHGPQFCNSSIAGYTHRLECYLKRCEIEVIEG